MGAQMLSILVVLCMTSLAQSRCPDPAGLPVIYPYNLKKFYCAQVFTGSHPTNPAMSCTGDMRHIANEANDAYLGQSFDEKITAIIVKPGCKFIAYRWRNFGGDPKVFTGANHHLKRCNETGLADTWICHTKTALQRANIWGDQIRSTSCLCDLHNAALSCKPREQYETIQTCVNDGEGEMECKHAIAKGMIMGSSVTQGKTVSTSTSASLSAAFKGVFWLGLSRSHNTTYDWKKTDATIFSRVTTSTITCTVPPGKTLRIMHVVGICDDTRVYTGYYKCTTRHVNTRDVTSTNTTN